MYKVVNTIQVPQTNEDGKQKHLLVTRGNGQSLAIPCYRMERDILAKGISFQEAKAIRAGHKGSEIVKE